MPQAWRITKRRYTASAFDGEGARLFGGRWNSPGRAAVYTSESRALATLEVLAGLRTPSVMASYVLIGVRFPDDQVEAVDPAALPRGWQRHPPHADLQSIGDRWLEERRSLALKVPSAIVPGEFNYMLNPLHHDASHLEIGPPEELRLDPRLLDR